MFWPAIFFVQPFVSPPSSSLSLTVPPILRKPLTPLSRSMLEQPSHDRPSEPKPKPNPIQNPWRVCGCWARAAAAPSRASSRAAAEIRVSMRMTNLLVGAPTAPSTKRGNGCFRVKPLSVADRLGRPQLHRLRLDHRQPLRLERRVHWRQRVSQGRAGRLEVPLQLRCVHREYIVDLLRRLAEIGRA